MDIGNNNTRYPESAEMLCVLGMHRSGTSVVTRFLHLLGAALAPKLLEPMEGVNQEGFWEDQCVVDINGRLLVELNSHWYDFRQPHITAPNNVVIERLRIDAIDHFKANYATKPLTVVKDPRLCRLLPFWIEVWATAKIHPIFIHVIRHPYAVAKSLQRRDNIPYEYTIVLWLMHVLEAISTPQTSQGLIITYDSFLQRPLDLAETLISRYCLEPVVPKIDWPEVADKTINNNLINNDAKFDMSLGLSEIRTFAVSVYEALSTSMDNSSAQLPIQQWYAELQQLLIRYDNELAMLDRLRAKLMRLSADNVRIGELHSAALAVIQQKDSMIEDKDLIINDQQKYISDLHHLRFWRIFPRILRKVRKI